MAQHPPRDWRWKFLNKQISEPAGKQTSKSANKQAPKPTGKQASKPAGKQASKPANKQASKSTDKKPTKQVKTATPKRYNAKPGKFSLLEYLFIGIATLIVIYSVFTVLQKYQDLKASVEETTKMQQETNAVQNEIDIITQELKQKNTDFDNSNYVDTVKAILGQSCTLEKIQVYQNSIDSSKNVLITTLTDINELETLTQASSLVIRFKVEDIQGYLEYVDTRGISFKSIDVIPLTNTIIVEYQFWGGEGNE